MNEIENVPKVPTLIRPSQSRFDRIWILEITCPYCGRRHHHGGGPTDGPPVLGERLSHCAGHATYELVPVEEETPS